MDIENNPMLVEWNKLLERFQAGESMQDNIALFTIGAQITHYVILQAHMAADAEWRQKLIQFHERQTELMRRQAVALERMARAMDGEHDD